LEESSLDQATYLACQEIGSFRHTHRRYHELVVMTLECLYTGLMCRIGSVHGSDERTAIHDCG
jgi:hypothetical protein